MLLNSRGSLDNEDLVVESLQPCPIKESRYVYAHSGSMVMVADRGQDVHVRLDPGIAPECMMRDAQSPALEGPLPTPRTELPPPGARKPEDRSYRHVSDCELGGWGDVLRAWTVPGMGQGKGGAMRGRKEGGGGGELKLTRISLTWPTAVTSSRT